MRNLKVELKVSKHLWKRSTIGRKLMRTTWGWVKWKVSLLCEICVHNALFFLPYSLLCFPTKSPPPPHAAMSLSRNIRIRIRWWRSSIRSWEVCAKEQRRRIIISKFSRSKYWSYKRTLNISHRNMRRWKTPKWWAINSFWHFAG